MSGFDSHLWLSTGRVWQARPLYVATSFLSESGGWPQARENPYAYARESPTFQDGVTAARQALNLLVEVRIFVLEPVDSPRLKKGSGVADHANRPWLEGRDNAN